MSSDEIIDLNERYEQETEQDFWRARLTFFTSVASRIITKIDPEFTPDCVFNVKYVTFRGLSDVGSKMIVEVVKRGHKFAFYVTSCPDFCYKIPTCFLESGIHDAPALADRWINENAVKHC